MPPAPTKSGTPPDRTAYVARYTKHPSSLESIPEEESKDLPNNWDNKHDDEEASDK